MADTRDKVMIVGAIRENKEIKEEHKPLDY